jgi:hypothetical protein
VKVDTWKVASDKVGVSEDTISKTKVILEKGDEELIEKCRRGEISVNEAYKRVREIKVNVMHPKELLFEILTKYFENQDLDTLHRLKENLGAIHEFLNELLSKGLLDKKGLEIYKKKLEIFRDLLGEIASWDQYIIERKQNK